MSILDINNRLGELSRELSIQFVTALFSELNEEEVLAGLIHEIAESPDKYYSIFGHNVVRLALAYNHAINSYMELDEIIMEQAEQPEPVPTPAPREEQKMPHLIEFPVDPFNTPMDN